MTRRLVLGVFLALTATTAMAQMKRGAAADEAAIRELAKQYSSAWNSGDAAKAAAVYADDAELELPKPDDVPVLWHRPAEQRGVVLPFPRREPPPTEPPRPTDS